MPGPSKSARSKYTVKCLAGPNYWIVDSISNYRFLFIKGYRPFGRGGSQGYHTMKYHTMILKAVVNNIMTYVKKYTKYLPKWGKVIGNFYFYLYRKNFFWGGVLRSCLFIHRTTRSNNKKPKNINSSQWAINLYLLPLQHFMILGMAGFSAVK